VLENNPRLRKFVPSPTGLGIGILVPFSVVFTMFIGGIIAWIWERLDAKSASIYLVPLASGLIAGEALVAVLVPLVLKLLHMAGADVPAEIADDSVKWLLRLGAFLIGGLALAAMRRRR